MDECHLPRIKNGEGQWLDRTEDIWNHIEIYFRDIFRSWNPSEDVLEKGLRQSRRSVTGIKCYRRSHSRITAEDILSTLSNGPLKSLRSDASKIIANRLKPLLDTIISPCQAAFVPDRLITNNVLLAFKVNHYLKTKTWGRKGHMALKLDISKAYNKIGWKFLEKAFSSLLQKEERNGSLQGVAVCRRAPKVSHHLFADDTLIFCQAMREAAACNLEILGTFGRAAGQEINFEKSSVVFSKNTTAWVRVEIQDAMRIRLEDRHDLYIELPSVVGKSRCKEVLIKVVAQATPTYAMSCFRFPTSLIKEIHTIVSNFWWHNGEARKIHWITGIDFANQRRKVGWDLEIFKRFNLAMLSKQL
ncbi:UNVERIFIED_CONTAM: hypothetical protein Sangu_1027800 [Sesamum angustifolium]|uniref:Reverse transcriptase n=1 Tax=Sesamum angustifolium TaxID=2727405 RepID=A0AAW2NVT9_9LAMI